MRRKSLGIMKLLLIPVWLIAMIMKLGMKLLLNMSEFAVGLIMMIYFVCIVITVCRHEWTQTFLVLAGAGITVVLVIAATSAVYLFENILNAVNDFMIS